MTSERRQPPLRRLVRRVEQADIPAWLMGERVTQRGRLRLLALFVLFDVLLVVAVVLSFQTTELIEEEITLQQTRQVYDIEIHRQVITDTTVITEVIPYGSTPQ
jgi:hypothetical protein